MIKIGFRTPHRQKPKLAITTAVSAYFIQNLRLQYNINITINTFELNKTKRYYSPISK